MPNFCALFKSVFRLHLLYVCALKVKGLENFQPFAFCLKLGINGGGGGGGGYGKIFNSLYNCIGTLRQLIVETISK